MEELRKKAVLCGYRNYDEKCREFGREIETEGGAALQEMQEKKGKGRDGV